MKIGRNSAVAQEYANHVIAELKKQQEGFISAKMIDYRESNGYCEPLIKMECEAGTFTAWARCGESVADMKWKEIEMNNKYVITRCPDGCEEEEVERVATLKAARKVAKEQNVPAAIWLVEDWDARPGTAESLEVINA